MQREEGLTQHTKFPTNFEVGREEKDGLEDILCLFKSDSSSLRDRQYTFPLPSLVPDLAHRGMPHSFTASSSLPWGMWKPVPAAELLHAPLLVSCLCAAHTSDSQSRLTLCGAARGSSRQAAVQGTAEQLLCAQAQDTAWDSCLHDLLSVLEHRVIMTAFQQLSPNIYGQSYLALITD